MLRFIRLVPICFPLLAGISCPAYTDTLATGLQEKLVHDQINSLNVNRNGVNDIYFIGFAPYSTEDVFMNEVTYVRNLFDLQYDTFGRSILLINNEKSLDLYPVATVTNLEKVFQKIGSIINPDEDIAVLYITSHGEKNLGISMKFENAGELGPERKYLDAKSLLQIFEENNIKWRIIFLLACYSGGFIETLKNDNTLIITSASGDRPSFGCGHHGDFTQFGEVMFLNNLSKTRDIVSSFNSARQEVENLEKEMGLKPSNPQIYAGKEILKLLDNILYK